MRVHLRGRVKIYPTEDPEKVKQAVGNFFPLSKVEVAEEGNSQTLTFEGEGQESLSKLRVALKQERIRDAVRRVLHESIEGGQIRFCLNKQVACVGRISLCGSSGESPLGPIEVEIEADDPYGLIDLLSPASPTEYAPSHKLESAAHKKV